MVFPQAQLAQQRQQGGPPPAGPSAPYQPPHISATPGPAATAVVAVGGGLYPSLDDYMGLELSRYNPVSELLQLVAEFVCMCIWYAKLAVVMYVLPPMAGCY